MQAKIILFKSDRLPGKLVAVDGSLIEAVLSMHWAEYRSKPKKAKLHLGFDINHGIPKKLALTDGNGGERPFVSHIVDPGETGILYRSYQDHRLFDQWREDGRHFVCRIKASTKKKALETFASQEDSGFYDAKVLLGTPGRQPIAKTIEADGVQGRRQAILDCHRSF